MRVLSGDKIYQAMEIESEFYATCYLAWVWNQRQEKITHATGRSSAIWWMPLAAALFGTVKWHAMVAPNFLSVIGLRVRASTAPRSPIDS